MSFTTPFRVAAVNAESAKWNVNDGVQLANRIVTEAVTAGASLVVFPELWLPGFANTDSVAPPEDFQIYADNSIEVGSSVWNDLVQVSVRNSAYVAMSFSEREGQNLFIAQVLIGPDGSVLDRRRKFKPSGPERFLFSDAPDHENLNVVDTPLGRIGSLSCAEHWKPQMTFPMMAQNENIHICAFPYNLDKTKIPAEHLDSHIWWEFYEMNETSATNYAMISNTWVIMASVGRSIVVNNFGQVVASAENSDSNFALADVDPASFGDAYDNVFTWATLQRMENSFPGPRVPDEFTDTDAMVDYRTVDTSKYKLKYGVQID
ncbi:nitrilase-related carbon-nitrogen hydrolase [Pseudarthrobacter sp. NPDC058329]|uniref:nitrilase-related carbon-nitrogen hydrolase n=1 Tax=Pseudarthrobacter sp. NPDC058329 TaxID=3346448 RepID=UPI0036DEB6B6